MTPSLGVSLRYGRAARRVSGASLLSANRRTSVAGTPGEMPIPCLPANSISQGDSDGAFNLRGAREPALVFEFQYFGGGVADHPLVVFDLNLFQQFDCPGFIDSSQSISGRAAQEDVVDGNAVFEHVVAFAGIVRQRLRRRAADVLVAAEQGMRHTFERFIRANGNQRHAGSIANGLTRRVQRMFQHLNGFGVAHGAGAQNRKMNQLKGGGGRKLAEEGHGAWVTADDERGHGLSAQIEGNALRLQDARQRAEKISTPGRVSGCVTQPAGCRKKRTVHGQARKSQQGLYQPAGIAVRGEVTHGKIFARPVRLVEDSPLPRCS